jgi:hypothetical protein
LEICLYHSANSSPKRQGAFSGAKWKERAEKDKRWLGITHKNNDNEKTTPMKTLLLLFLGAATAVSATTLIPVDLGQPGAYFTKSYPVAFSAPLQGQEIAFDIAFNNSITILAGQYSRYFDLGVVFHLDQPTLSFVQGTGFLTTPNGPVSCAFGGGAFAGGIFFGLFPLLTVNDNLNPPVTFDGAHFDVILPLSTSSITSSNIELLALTGPRANGFRIGPHVPENASSAFLLMVGVSFLALFRQIKGKLATGDRPSTKAARNFAQGATVQRAWTWPCGFVGSFARAEISKVRSK